MTLIRRRSFLLAMLLTTLVGCAPKLQTSSPARRARLQPTMRSAFSRYTATLRT